MFRHNFFGEYFDKYKPDLVFSTSIISGPDIYLMKEAVWRGIKSVSIPKGWDNIAKTFYRFVPNKILVQNKLMKEEISEVQRISAEKVRVVGFPQFDFYVKNKHFIMPREDFFRKIGLDPKREMIFFGSEGKWAPYDDSIADTLAEFILQNKTIKPCSLFIRPHYSDLRSGHRFGRFSGVTNIKIDDNFRISDFFIEAWDPDFNETVLFMNSLYHSSILVTTTSTLTLDAACFDRPIINVAYGVLYKGKKDVSDLFYIKQHYKWVLDTGAVDLVHSKEEFLNSVNAYLGDSGRKRKERQTLVENVIGGIDGRSSERLSSELIEMLK